MTKRQAVDILNDHNRWRRQEPPYTETTRPRYTAKEVGEAIDYAIHYMKNNGEPV